MQSRNFVRAIGTAVFVALQLLFFVYPGVSTTILRTFAYDKIKGNIGGDSEPYYSLRYDYTIDYHSPSSAFWRIYAGIIIVVYPVGSVIVFILGVWLHKRWKSRPGEKNVKEEVSKMPSFLVKPFKPQYAYFESYELVRKLFLTSVIMLVHQESPGGAKVTFILMLCTCLVVLLTLKPYEWLFEQFFAAASLSLLLLLAIISIFPELVPDVSGELIAFLTIAILVTELVLLLMVAILVVLVEKKKLTAGQTGCGHVQSQKASLRIGGGESTKGCEAHGFRDTMDGSTFSMDLLQAKNDAGGQGKSNSKKGSFSAPASAPASTPAAAPASTSSPAQQPDPVQQPAQQPDSDPAQQPSQQRDPDPAPVSAELRVV